MKTAYAKKFGFISSVFTLLLLMGRFCFADESTIFDCGTDSAAVAAVENPFAKRYGIAIYACKNPAPAGTTALPFWWDDEWFTGTRPGVYTYYQDISRGKYSISADPFGANNTTCYTSSEDPGTALDVNLNFVTDILRKADDDPRINFANWDHDNDGIVDALFLFVVNDTNTVPDGIYFGYGTIYTTKDTNWAMTPPQPVSIDGSRTVWIRAQSWDWANAVACHEWGHALGLPDLYGFHDFSEGLGGFSLMGKGFPGGRAVPFDPWSLQKLGWDSTIEVTAPIYGQSIPDYASTGVIYKLPKDSLEYFLVNNYWGKFDPNYPATFWEEKFKGFGPLIWHVDKTGDSVSLDFSHKVVDLEAAHGLFNSDGCQFTTTPNPAAGWDSLDVTVGCGLPDTSRQSMSCFYNAITQKTIFDGLSNPNSNGYVDSVDVFYGTRVQIVPTHVAVRKIQTSIAAGNPATADLLVNNWYGHITANTTWGPGVYAITGDITVDSGYTLTIDSGTTVFFQNNEDNQRSGVDIMKCEINVARGGKLIVKGQSSAPIRLLSSRSGAQAGTDDWYGIRISGGGSAKIKYCTVRDAYAGIIYAGTPAAPDTIQNVHIAHCKLYGIRADSATSLVVRNCGIDSAQAPGYGIYVNSTTTAGPKLTGDTARACSYGLYIHQSTSPVDSCVILGPGTTGITSYGQGIIDTLNLTISNTAIDSQFTNEHFSHTAGGRTILNRCEIVSTTVNRSPNGVRNTSGTYLKVRYSSILEWGSTGVITGHANNQVTDLGVFPGDGGSNSIYTSATGSSWKYVKDVDCSGCISPIIRAQWNQWNAWPPSGSRFTPNIDYSHYQPPSDPKLIAGGGSEILPRRTALSQNYPNPFNPTTLIQFNLEKSEKVNLEIFNILGQKVRTLLAGEEFAAGPYSFLWDGKDDKGQSLSSGIYFYRLKTPTYLQTKKMTLLK